MYRFPAMPIVGLQHLPNIITLSRIALVPQDPAIFAASARENIAFFPLAIPMLAGPGAISTAMVLMGQSQYWWQALPVFFAIAVTAVTSFYILAAADRVGRRLGATSIRVLMRLMGLVLATIAVQFVINGFADIGALNIPKVQP